MILEKAMKHQGIDGVVFSKEKTAYERALEQAVDKYMFADGYEQMFTEATAGNKEGFNQKSEELYQRIHMKYHK